MFLYKELLKIIDYIKIFKSNHDVNFINVESYNCINLDFSDKHNHWGDLTFLGPLLEGFYKNGIKFNIQDKYDFLNNLFFDSNSLNKKPFDFTIYRSYSARLNNSSNIHLNFYDFPEGPIARTIHNLFLNKDNYYDNKSDFVKRLINSCSNSKFNTFFNKEYVIYSPGINSRKFGFYPNSSTVNSDIKNTVYSFAQKNIDIVLIGDSESKNFSVDLSCFNNIIDITGQTNWMDLIAIINNPFSLGLIGYDNFPYHLSTLLDKKTYLFSKSWLNKYEYNWISKRYTPGF